MGLSAVTAIRISETAELDFGRGELPAAEGQDPFAEIRQPSTKFKPHKIIKLLHPEISNRERTHAPHLKHSTERELKFFVPLDILRAQLNFDKLERQLIRSNYFPLENTPAVQEVLEHLAGYKRLSRHARPKVSRLQMVVDEEGNKEYFICLKGERRGKYGTERPEIPIKISEANYEVLLPYANSGELWKPRLLKTGHVHEQDGTRRSVKIHIDFPDQAGLKKDTLQEGLYQQFNFATIDVELPYARLQRRLRLGHHDIKFLRPENGAIELTDSDIELRKALSTRRLARRGVDKRTKSAIKALHRQCNEQLARDEDDDA